MANVVKVIMQHGIVALLERGRSQRSILRELGLARETVSRYARLWWERGGGNPNQAIPTAGSAGRRSDCEPFRETIVGRVPLGLSAQRIWQDLQEASDSAPRDPAGFDEALEPLVNAYPHKDSIRNGQCFSARDAGRRRLAERYGCSRNAARNTVSVTRPEKSPPTGLP